MAIPCPNCGREFEQEHVPEFCPTCGAKVEKPEQYYSGGEFEEAPVGAGYYCPWEDRANLGALKALWETLKGVITRPANFFAQMPPRGGYGNPISQAIIFGMIGGLFAMIWSSLFQFSMMMFFESFIPQGEFPEEMFQTQPLGMAAGFIAGIICMPFLIPIGLFIVSLILHLCLMLVGGATEGFEATFRAYSYTYPLQIFRAIPIPIFVDFGVSIWQLVVIIIAMREMHHISTGKAAFAVLLPTLVLCFCIALFTVLFFAVMFTGMNAGGGF